MTEKAPDWYKGGTHWKCPGCGHQALVPETKRVVCWQCHEASPARPQARIENEAAESPPKTPPYDQSAATAITAAEATAEAILSIACDTVSPAVANQLRAETSNRGRPDALRCVYAMAERIRVFERASERVDSADARTSQLVAAALAWRKQHVGPADTPHVINLSSLDRRLIAAVDAYLAVKEAPAEAPAAHRDVKPASARLDDEEALKAIGAKLDEERAKNARLHAELDTAIQCGQQQIDQLLAAKNRIEELSEQNARFKEISFVPPVGPRVCCALPDVQTAIDLGMNGFAFQLVGETMAHAAPRNPNRLPVIVTVRRGDFVIDVEARFREKRGACAMPEEPIDALKAQIALMEPVVEAAVAWCRAEGGSKEEADAYHALIEASGVYTHSCRQGSSS